MPGYIPWRMPVDLGPHNTQPLSRNLSHGESRAAFCVPAMVDSYPRDGENDAGIQTRCNEAGSCNKSNPVGSRYENYVPDSRC